MSAPKANYQPPDDHTELYEIRIKGHISPGLSEWFKGLEVTQLPTGETILSGPVTDQAALHGLLASIRDLNLPLISVTRVDSEHSPSGAGDTSDSIVR
jgi:hypothetical protein